MNQTKSYSYRITPEERKILQRVAFENKHTASSYVADLIRRDKKFKEQQGKKK